MTDDQSSDDDGPTVDPRTRRARTEDMGVALRKTGGIYTVGGDSGNTYRVDIATEECTYPDQQKTATKRCKHLRRVEMEIRNRTFPTPDGRLPERPVVDGRIGTEDNAEQSTDQRRVTGPIQEADTDGRPTGAAYYRWSVCGREAMRRQDLSSCCPVARR